MKIEHINKGGGGLPPKIQKLIPVGKSLAHSWKNGASISGPIEQGNAVAVASKQTENTEVRCNPLPFQKSKGVQNIDCTLSPVFMGNSTVIRQTCANMENFYLKSCEV